MYDMFFMGVKKGGNVLPDFHLPILPQKVKEVGGKENEKFNSLSLGEVVKPGPRKLKRWEIGEVPYSGEGTLAVEEFKSFIDAASDMEEHFIFVLNRILESGTTIYNKAEYVHLEDYSFEDREGEPGTLYFTLKLIEARSPGAKKVNQYGTPNQL